MSPVLSERATFGVIVPSTNTVVEAEYNQMRPPGVSYHAGRIFIRNETLDSDETFESFLVDLREEMGRAIRDVATCKPDYLIMGMSAETFWGGAAGNARFISWVEEQCGLKVSTGASACKAALEALGAKRIGVITPYQPVGDTEVRRFFEDLGYEVSEVVGLKCPTATSIADVTREELLEAFAAVDGDDIDALVQCGTNLAVAHVAPALEQELGKPVVAINVACVWHALRANGIDDKLPGWGRLFEEH